MTRWHVQHPGASATGPTEVAELQSAWRRQQIPPGTVVCAEGHAQWVPFHTVPELVAPGSVPAGSGSVVPTPHGIVAPTRQGRAAWFVATVVSAGLLLVGFQLMAGAAAGYNQRSDGAGPSTGANVMLTATLVAFLVVPILLFTFCAYRLTRSGLLAGLLFFGALALAGVTFLLR